jgi:hypothetical protein
MHRHRPEGCLDDRLAEQAPRLGHEEPGDLGVVPRDVAAAASDRGDVAHQPEVRLVADRDGRHGDLRLGQRRDERLDRAGLGDRIRRLGARHRDAVAAHPVLATFLDQGVERLRVRKLAPGRRLRRHAVGQQDDVLRRRGRRREHPLRLDERRMEARLSARRHARDEVLRAPLVADRRERHDLVRFRVERDDREPVAILEQIERRQRRRLREFELATAHAVRAVDEQHEIEIASLPPALEAHGQQAFERTAREAFLPVRALARREDQPAARVTDEPSRSPPRISHRGSARRRR